VETETTQTEERTDLSVNIGKRKPIAMQ
jgi:hypothetical protein